MDKTEHTFKVTILLFAVTLILAIAYFSDPQLSDGQKSLAHADTLTSPTPTQAVQKTLTFRTWTQASGIFKDNGVNVVLSNDIQKGDLLIAVAGFNGTPASWTTPTGWVQGTNTATTNAQGLMWWWKVADGSEAGSTVNFQSSSYADGGVVVNVYEGQAANPIAAVSSLTTNDNFGNGHVTSANVAEVTTSTPITAVPLIFASWQPNYNTVSSPNGFGFESTATDGYSYVGVWERYYSLTTNTFPAYSISFTPGAAVVQTLQILINVR